MTFSICRASNGDKKSSITLSEIVELKRSPWKSIRSVIEPEIQTPRILFKYLQVGSIPRKTLSSRIRLVLFFLIPFQIELCLAIILGEKKFSKNHKFWSKIEFESLKGLKNDLLRGPPGWNLSQKKEEVLFYWKTVKLDQALPSKKVKLRKYAWHHIQDFENFFFLKYT